MWLIKKLVFGILKIFLWKEKKRMNFNLPKQEMTKEENPQIRNN